MEDQLSPKAQKAMDLWWSIELSPEWYAWLEDNTVPAMAVSFKDLTDEQADECIAVMQKYKDQAA